MIGPSFLVIGAQKCGTTWLHRNLQDHPGVWLPPEKELHFLDERWGSTTSLWQRATGKDAEAQRWRRQVKRQAKQLREDTDRREHLGWYARFFLGNGGVEWYRGLFRPTTGQIAGEVTPDYAIVPRAIVRDARDAFPDLRIVLVVRHPIERVWSHAQMEERLGGQPAHDTAIELLDRRRARLHTDYARTLRIWGQVFGEDRVFLGFNEDIAHHPRAVLNAVTDHVGAERNERYPAAARRVHTGGAETMPADTATALAGRLQEQVAELAADLGGHARWWSWSTDRLAEGGRTGTVEYPLTGDELRTEYLATVDADADRYASGRLDVLRAAAQG